MDNNNKPLYKVLNEQRTQGEWKISAICYNSIIAGEIPKHTDILCTDPKNTIKLFDKIPDSEDEQKANAQYTALAVNNLHHLAEALEYLMEGVSQLPALSAIEGVLIPHFNKAKEALKRIS